MADTTPLLAGGAEVENRPIQSTVSDCKLQDKCFLSEGASADTGGYNKVQRKLIVACVLCFIFMIVEVIGGYIAKSVAIMSDAAHMLSDVAAFLVSIFAAWAATQPASWHYSFGYHRAEILGALVSVLAIWAVTGALVFEAFQRTIRPVKVDGKLMFIISMAGVVFNILIALTLGVHAHLGHSHGPDGGCSGHSHGHSHDHAGHGHEHCSHSHSEGGKAHSHSEGGKAHSHAEGGKAHSHQHGSSCSGHGHEHAPAAQSNGQQTCSSHDHDHHDHGSHSHSSSDDNAEQSHDHAHDTHDHDHDHSHDSASTREVVITIPAAITPALAAGGADPHCGQAGHALSCRCTISRKGSREIEVRCELPLPAAATVAAVTSASAGHSHEASSINLRGAVLHVIGDLLQSIGVAIAGALIWYNQDDPRWYLADPICTFAFSILVLLTTRYVLRDIVHVLMERTPANMHLPTVSQELMAMDGIADVHDLHIWNISTSTAPVLTAHVHIGPDADANEMLQKLEAYVKGLGIEHSTIQICNPAAPPQAS